MPRTLECFYPNCRYQCTKASHLQRHAKSHTKERDFKCRLCPADFSRKDSLTRHVLSQHPKVSENIQIQQQGSRNTPYVEIEDPAVEDYRRLAGSSATSSSSPSASSNAATTSRHMQVDATMPSQDIITTMNNSVTFDHSAGLEEYQHIPISNDIQASSISVASNGCLDWNQSDHQDSQMEKTSPSALSSALWDVFCNNISEAVFGVDMLVQPSDLISASNTIDTSMPTDLAFHGSNDEQRDNGRIVNVSTGSTQPYGSSTPTRAHFSNTQTPYSTRPSSPHRLSTYYNDTSKTLESMKSNLRSFMHQMQPPKRGPSTSMTEQCIWACQRHFLATSPFMPAQSIMSRCSQRPGLLMNLIALGSLWQASTQDVEKGAEMWHFVLGTNWCNGWRMVDTAEATAYTMLLLFTGHSYTMMTSNAHIHQMGRAAWQYAHSFALDSAWQAPFHDCRDVDYDLLQIMSKNELATTFRIWQGDEEKLRVALCLAILDSQQSRMFSNQSQFQALIMRSPESAPEELFQSPNPLDWRKTLDSMGGKVSRRWLGDLMKQLFKAHILPTSVSSYNDLDYSDMNMIPIQQLSMSTLLEGISNACQLEARDDSRTSGLWDSNCINENVEARKRIQGTDQKALHALANWATWWLNGSRPTVQYLSSLPPAQDTHGLEIRWHAVHLAIFSRNVNVLEPLSKLRKVQSTFPMYRFATQGSEGGHDLKEWLAGASGRRAMFHAGRIVSCFVRLPRDLTLAIGVAQSVLDAVVLLVCLAVEGAASRRQGGTILPRTSAIKFDLVPPYHSCQHWVQLGYAGMQESTLDRTDSRITADWMEAMIQITTAAAPQNLPHQQQICPQARGSECGQTKQAREWIQFGRTEDVFIMGTPAYQAHHAIQEIVRLIRSANLKWCYAYDCIDLLEQSLRSLTEQTDS